MPLTSPPLPISDLHPVNPCPRFLPFFIERNENSHSEYISGISRIYYSVVPESGSAVQGRALVFKLFNQRMGF